MYTIFKAEYVKGHKLQQRKCKEYFNSSLATHNATHFKLMG